MSKEAYTLDSWVLHQLQQTTQYFHEQQKPAYLVGGSIRNILLHEACTDWDIVIDGDAPKLARRLANALGGFYAHMHDKASRVIVKHHGQDISFDISPMYGHMLETDLRQRDFTINAIATPLDSVVQHFTTGEPLSLIDPLHGVHDLTAHCLKAVDDGIFQRDPLRLLRAVRFIMRYHLTLDSHTEGLIIRDASLLLETASERIHEEFYTILEPEGAINRLHFLDNHGLLTTLMPEFIPARGMSQPGLHHWDVFEHSLETVATLEQLAVTLQQAPVEMRQSPLASGDQDDLVALQVLLNQAEQQGIFQCATVTTPAMKLAALLHDVGKTITHAVDEAGNIHFYGHPQVGVPLAQQIMKRLNVSTQERRLIQLIVANHMRPGQLSQDDITPRAIRRYFVELGAVGIHVALISLADHLAMRGPEPLTATWTRHLATVRLLLTRYIRERQSILPPRLLQAEELMHHFQLQPGPLVGQLLDAIAEAQAEGTVQSKSDAYWLVEERLQDL
jgi:putative nucleotidyltransferase with HDIG domain